MPVWRSVVVRFSHAKPKHLNIAAGQLSADLLPDSIKITLRGSWTGPVPFAITMTEDDIGMLFGRCCHGEKLPCIATFGSDFLKATNASHKLNAAQSRVRYALIYLLNE